MVLFEIESVYLCIDIAIEAYSSPTFLKCFPPPFVVSTLVVSGLMNMKNTISLYFNLGFTQVLGNKVDFILPVWGFVC